MKTRILLCLLATLCFMQPAWATDKKNNYLILGPGAYPCSKIVGDLVSDAKRRNPASVIVYSNWLAGNLTAYDRVAKNTYSILGDTTITEAFQEVVDYCQSHPDDIYASAVDMLIKDLQEDRYTTLPAPEKPKAASAKESDRDDDDDTDK